FPVNTTGGSAGGEIERVCKENELVIATWSPIHLRTKLKEIYWKDGQSATGAMGFFEDTLRYLYLPRFRNRDVLAQAIGSGAASRDFFGTAYGQSGGKFEGFQLGGGDVVFDDTLLLIEPEAAKAYEEANRLAPPQPHPHPEPPPGPPGVAPPPGTQPPPPPLDTSRQNQGSRMIIPDQTGCRLLAQHQAVATHPGTDQPLSNTISRSAWR
ncbi:MAG: hypothetical protein KA125_03075, partial [Chromatiaceae bacterium]|nr:hypothetical protein [Chromatiaceae bacterium]